MTQRKNKLPTDRIYGMVFRNLIKTSKTCTPSRDDANTTRCDPDGYKALRKQQPCVVYVNYGTRTSEAGSLWISYLMASAACSNSICFH